MSILTEMGLGILGRIISHPIIHKLFDGAGEHVSRKIEEYKSIKESSDEDNNLFAQLLATIFAYHTKKVQIMTYSSYVELKSWFESAGSKMRNRLPEKILALLPDVYWDRYCDDEQKTLKIILDCYGDTTGAEFKYLVLSPLYSILSGKNDDDRFKFIQNNFFNNIDDKSTVEAATNEFADKNPIDLKSLNANQIIINPFQIWSDFVDNLKTIIKPKKMKGVILSYKNLNGIEPDDNTLIHNFINDFMNNIANQVKMETHDNNRTTGKDLKNTTPVFVWMENWLNLPSDEDRLKLAVATIKIPRTFLQDAHSHANKTIKKLREVDRSHASKTTAPGGLAWRLNQNARNLRRR